MSYEQVVKSIMVTYVWPTGVITGRWWNCGRTLGSCVGPREYTLATPDEVEAVSPGVGASSPSSSSSSSSSSPPRSSSRDVVPPLRGRERQPPGRLATSAGGLGPPTGRPAHQHLLLLLVVVGGLLRGDLVRRAYCSMRPLPPSAWHFAECLQ